MHSSDTEEKIIPMYREIIIYTRDAQKLTYLLPDGLASSGSQSQNRRPTACIQEVGYEQVVSSEVMPPFTDTVGFIYDNHARTNTLTLKCNLKQAVSQALRGHKQDHLLPRIEIAEQISLLQTV
jgi:hypothetical protein